MRFGMKSGPLLIQFCTPPLSPSHSWVRKEFPPPSESLRTDGVEVHNRLGSPEMGAWAPGFLPPEEFRLGSTNIEEDRSLFS